MLKCRQSSTFGQARLGNTANLKIRESMKKTTMQRGLFAILLLACFAAAPLHAQDRFEVILAEIKEIRVDMKQLRMEMNQFRVEMNQFRKETVLRFEQVDKRFEQVNERFEFIQTILGILIMGVLAGPFIAEWLRRRREERKQRMWDELQRLLIAMRSLARKDTQVHEALEDSRLL